VESHPLELDVEEELLEDLGKDKAVLAEEEDLLGADLSPAVSSAPPGTPSRVVSPRCLHPSLSQGQGLISG
jgi:hypothetical protein